MANTTDDLIRQSGLTPFESSSDSFQDDIISKSFQQARTDQQLNLEHAKQLYKESMKGKINMNIWINNLTVTYRKVRVLQYKWEVTIANKIKHMTLNRYC